MPTPQENFINAQIMGNGGAGSASNVNYSNAAADFGSQYGYSFDPQYGYYKDNGSGGISEAQKEKYWNDYHLRTYSPDGEGQPYEYEPTQAEVNAMNGGAQAGQVTYKGQVVADDFYSNIVDSGGGPRNEDGTPRNPFESDDQRSTRLMEEYNSRNEPEVQTQNDAEAIARAAHEAYLGSLSEDELNDYYEATHRDGEYEDDFYDGSGGGDDGAGLDENGNYSDGKSNVSDAQQNFLDAKAKGELTDQQIKQAEEFANAHGYKFDPDTGYSARGTSTQGGGVSDAQQNFVDARNAGTLTKEQIRQAEDFANAHGYNFNPETGYSKQPAVSPAQQNFLDAKNSFGGITQSEIEAAQRYADAYGYDFDPNLGYGPKGSFDTPKGVKVARPEGTYKGAAMGIAAMYNQLGAAGFANAFGNGTSVTDLMGEIRGPYGSTIFPGQNPITSGTTIGSSGGGSSIRTSSGGGYGGYANSSSSFLKGASGLLGSSPSGGSLGPTSLYSPTVQQEFNNQRESMQNSFSGITI